jgi:phospholipase/lecithinase/hemolysin
MRMRSVTMNKGMVLSVWLLMANIWAVGANAQFSGLVAFGDSLSDLGNTYHAWGDQGSYVLAGYNSNFYKGGRWSNGRLWVEVLNDQLKLPVLQRNSGTNRTGTNFAWGGSTSGAGYSYELLANLQVQIGSYLRLSRSSGSHMPDISKTLFTVWSGGNDLIYRMDDGTAITPLQVVGNIGQAIAELYHAGGRYFLVPNLPPLGEKPNYVTNSYKRAEANRFVDRYNSLLQSELAQLQNGLSGVTIIQLDCNKLFRQILVDPATNGFADVKDSAYTGKPWYPPRYGYVVKNPDQYLFWDFTHPTRATHEILGTEAYKAVLNAVSHQRNQEISLVAPAH